MSICNCIRGALILSLYLISVHGSYLPPAYYYRNNVHEPLPPPPSKIVHLQQYTQGTQYEEIHHQAQPQEHELQLEHIPEDEPNHSGDAELEHRYPDKVDYQVAAVNEILNRGNQAIDEQEKKDKEVFHTVRHENTVFRINPHMEEEVNKTEEFIMRPRNGASEESREHEQQEANKNSAEAIFVQVQLEPVPEPQQPHHDSELERYEHEPPQQQFIIHEQSPSVEEQHSNYHHEPPQQIIIHEQPPSVEEQHPNYHHEPPQQQFIFHEQPPSVEEQHPNYQHEPQHFQPQQHPQLRQFSNEQPASVELQHPGYHDLPNFQPHQHFTPLEHHEAEFQQHFQPPPQQEQEHPPQQQPSIIQIQGPMGPGQPPFQGQIILPSMGIPQLPPLPPIPQFFHPQQQQEQEPMFFPGPQHQLQGPFAQPGFPMNHP